MYIKKWKEKYKIKDGKIKNKKKLLLKIHPGGRTFRT
jgi:hypothetical protein